VAVDPDVAATTAIPAALDPAMTAALALVVAVEPDVATPAIRPAAGDPHLARAKADAFLAGRWRFLFDLDHGDGGDPRPATNDTARCRTGQQGDE